MLEVFTCCFLGLPRVGGSGYCGTIGKLRSPSSSLSRSRPPGLAEATAIRAKKDKSTCLRNHMVESHNLNIGLGEEIVPMLPVPDNQDKMIMCCLIFQVSAISLNSIHIQSRRESSLIRL